jgi:hypothetical protein
MPETITYMIGKNSNAWRGSRKVLVWQSLEAAALTEFEV